MNATLNGDRTGPEGPPRREMPWGGDPSLCAADQLSFENCPSGFFRRKMRHRRLPRDLSQIAGDLAHKAASIDDPAERERELTKALARVPGDKREAAELLVRELVDAADAMQDEYVGEVVKDTQVFWYHDTDELRELRDTLATDWGLPFKPDEIGMVWSDKYQQEILQIADLKSGVKMSEKMPYKARHQLIFFGMVAHLARVFGYEGPIRLVVKFMGSQDELEMFYQPNATPANLRRTRRVIRQIEACIDNNCTFPETTGLHCKRCPFRRDCASYPAYAASQGWTEEDQGSWSPRRGEVVPLPVLPPAASQ